MSATQILKIRTNIDDAQTELDRVLSTIASHEVVGMDDEALWLAAFRLEERVEILSALL